MTLFPNAKINIGLKIISRREDGFHDIETIFYPVALRDALEFVTMQSNSDSDELTVTGFNPGCRMSDNLVIRALNSLRRDFNIPALRIHLHKAIPMGAGLGGGSSDSAFMLRYLNRYFRLGLCNKDMWEIALKIGSDCPFFIENRPAFAEGRGEKLKGVSRVLTGYHILIIHPGIQISTANAYAGSKPEIPSVNLMELYERPVKTWNGVIENDFESWVFRKYPEIKRIKEKLYSSGAVYSSMSGSGSAVYGIYTGSPPASIFNGKYWKWQGVFE
ncbi:MAG TPA: 4-(cytidine 5'-diphospho)-2-C-methyl-D-erythritol kinase [Bacteroidales bacterium]|nr:4-(cytidine 5'-diphospho)-2-C-methyl-D-erythritol kinase [Bacteroidales bacterium]